LFRGGDGRGDSGGVGYGPLSSCCRVSTFSVSVAGNILVIIRAQSCSVVGRPKSECARSHIFGSL
jgi:hypothetical protein